MDTRQSLQQCFDKLGYSLAFPNNLNINPSTNFIWQQVLNNVKPKREVEVIRKNIIINRIEKKLPESAMACPVPEMQIHRRLKDVGDDIASITARIQDKQNKLNSIRNNRKANYLIINSMKQKNEEKRIKTHSLKLKSQHQEKEIIQIQEILDKKEIVSIPVEHSLSSDAITKLLQCLVEETEKCSRSSQYTNSNLLKHSILSRPNILSSITRSSKGCFSTVKKSQPRQNDLQRFVSCNNLTASRALFTETFKENNRNTKNCADLYPLDTSADLLPESCFNFEADDEFLISSQPTRGQKFMRSDLTINSKKDNTLGSISNVHGQSNSNLERNNQKHDYFNQALLNKNATRWIEELYDGGNREMIWISICSLLANLKLELEKNIHTVNFKNREICNDDLPPLNFIYIKNKLMCLKSKKQIKRLKNAIGELKSEIQRKLNQHDGGSIQTMDLHLDKIKLEAAIHFLHREVYSDNKTDHHATLKTLKTKIDKSKDDLLVKVKEIGDYIELKEDLMGRMKKCQEDTSACVRKLSKFLFNMSWADDLKETINSNEINVFREYPFEYIKQYCFVEKGAFYRDSIKDVFLDQLIPNDIIYEVTTLLQHPQYPPEKILADIIQKKNKAEVLSSLEFPEVSVEENQYSLYQFQEQENYISTFCENMNAFIHSSKVHDILKSSSHLRLNMELWLEVPFRRFISQKRMVDGKTYSEYEEAFEYFKNNN